VAIDPELLGKAYEKFNAIRTDNFDEFEKALTSGKKGDENMFNRQFGVFYTPRHFVHYMCRQSLIQYLYTELSGKIPIKDLETLIHLGEQISAHEARVMDRSRETPTYSHKLPPSIRENARVLDDRLARVTVCDPAVGSGAFPVGMMIEIVKARMFLAVLMNQADARSEYDLKRHAIEYCLFGVDIDPGAVEVAKLRLWLSLVVDEDDFKNIKPLPNLDYKVYRGNSLICAPEHAVTKTNIAGEIEKLITGFFSETHPGRKQELQQEIDSRIASFFEMAEKGFGYKVDFDFRLIFSEVFRKKNGFDVIIGNPPYIQLQKDGGRLARLYSGLGFKTFERTGDIYALFYENGMKMLKPGGHLCFITSSKWMRSGYGKSLRRLFSSYNPVMLISLGPGVFENATVDTNILIIQKEKNRNQLEGITLVKDTRENSLAEYISEHKTRLPAQGEESWFIGNQAELRLKDKIQKLGRPLKDWDANIFRGVLTGYNAAFIVGTPTRDRLVAEDPKSAEILKPVLRGRDVERYTYNWAGMWLIATFPALRIDIEDYPFIKNYLLEFGKAKLEQTGKTLPGGMKSRKKTGNKWFETQDQIGYYQEFDKEKVVWIELADKGRFAYVEPGIYTEATTFLMTLSKPKYFVGCLNSRLTNWYFNSICASSGMGTNRWEKIYVELLPIPPITTKNQPIVDEIETLVDRIIDMKKNSQDTTDLENRIDQLVYQLYDLTPEEIEVVEG
jgi:hypothetical protein